MNPPTASPRRYAPVRRRPPGFAFGLAAALWVCATGVLCAQEETGVVVGIVVDSTAMRPLADAAVFLWGTPHQAVTDSLGLFAIPDVPAGDYSAVFFHERLGELGISPGPVGVTVVPRDSVEVVLGTPSAYTLIATECAFDPDAQGVAVGRALDGESGLPLPNVRVHLDWSDDGDEAAGRKDVRTDADGWFAVCDLPLERVVVVTAEFLDRMTLRRELEIGSTPSFVDLEMVELELTDIEGRLVDSETGEGVPDATVALRGTGFRTVSRSDGRFEFRQVLPGRYTLEAEHLAYGPRSDPIDLGSGLKLRLEVQVAQRAIELPPITVTVEAENLRDRAMGGTVLPGARLDEVRDHSRDLGDLLLNSNVRGVIVNRQGATPCVGFLTGQVRIMFRAGCVPAIVFVDNVRVADPRQAFEIPANVIDRIVLYRPIEAGNLFGLGGGNGVVMVFTKSR